MKYIIDNNGFYVGFGLQKTELSSGQSRVEFPPPINLIKPKFEDGQWLEAATEEELQAREAEIESDNKRLQYEELLPTDWYIVRQVETGVPVPEHILAERAEIRNRYNILNKKK